MKLSAICLSLGLVLAVAGVAQADMIYEDHQDVYTVLETSWLYPDTVHTTYMHANPYESVGGFTAAEYEAAVIGGLITDVSLTLVIDDLDNSDPGEAYILPVGLEPSVFENWELLGELNHMVDSDAPGPDPGPGHAGDSGRCIDHMTTTTFSGIDPGWLDGLPTGVLITSGWCDGNAIELETSVLRITAETSCPPPVPAPGAALLGLLGLSAVGWFKRQ